MAILSARTRWQMRKEGGEVSAQQAASSRTARGRQLSLPALSAADWLSSTAWLWMFSTTHRCHRLPGSRQPGSLLKGQMPCKPITCAHPCISSGARGNSKEEIWEIWTAHTYMCECLSLHTALNKIKPLMLFYCHISSNILNSQFISFASLSHIKEMKELILWWSISPLAMPVNLGPSIKPSKESP